MNLPRAADRLTGDRNPTILATLAAAYAEVGRFGEAVPTAGRALELATAQTNSVLANLLQMQIELYRAGSPFRDARQADVSHSP